MSATYANVADLCQPLVRYGSPGRVVRSLAVRPFPRPCQATLTGVPRNGTARSSPGRSGEATTALQREILRAAEGWYAVSTAEPGTEPVTFRAMFIQELRARREQTGLLQREFAEKAHVSLSSVKQYEAGRKKPGRKFAIWCDDLYGCPGTFERLYDGMIAESHPSWFGPRVLLEDKAACVDEWEIRGIIAVGTALAGGPPRRSQRAGLPHWAPAMSIWRRTAVRETGA